MTQNERPVAPNAPSKAATAPSGPIGFPAVNVTTLRNYEDLDGGQGREVFFRADRFRSDELAPLELSLSLVQEGERFGCEILDLASGGLGVHWQSERPAVVGHTAFMELAADGRVMHAGEVRVTSVRETIIGPVAGLALVQGYLDIEQMVQLRDVQVWGGTEETTFALPNRSWSFTGHADFAAAVAEFRLFLEDAERHFGEMEAASPWYLIHGNPRQRDDEMSVGIMAGPGWITDEHPARATLIERIRAEFVPEVLRHYHVIDQAMRRADPAIQPQLRKFSQRHLDDLMLKAPLLHRARTKPLGYPGDFECMNYMYFRPFEGQTLFGKALHMASCASVPAQGVRARKDFVKQRVREALAIDRGGQPLRIASIASGPAQETYELLAELPLDHAPIEMVLFDQDRLALSFAQRRTMEVVRTRGLKNVRLLFLHDSIKRLLTDPGIFGTLGPFDLLFSTGLFDYLKPATASILCNNFYTNLAPGGSAYVGNMMPWNPSRWVFEHHLEWTLLYRTHDDMIDFARNGAPTARVQVMEEASGVNPFVVMTKEPA